MPENIKTHIKNDTVKSVNKEIKSTVKGIKNNAKNSKGRRAAYEHNIESKNNAFERKISAAYYEQEIVDREYRSNRIETNFNTSDNAPMSLTSESSINNDASAGAIQGRGNSKSKDSPNERIRINTTKLRNIKTPGAKATRKAYSEIKQISEKAIKSDDSESGKVISSTAAVSGASGYIAYKSTKVVSNIPSRIERRKDLIPAEKNFARMKKDTIKNNKQAKDSIRFAKQKYKYVKSQARNNPNSAYDIKNAKSAYKTTKKTETAYIKENKRALRRAKRDVDRAMRSIKRLKFYAAVVAIVFGVTILASVASLFVSPLGIVFASEDGAAGSYTINSAITLLNDEFAQVIHNIEEGEEYDLVSISNYGCQYTIANWQDVFAVWDIKQLESGLVFVIEEEQYQLLRSIVWDMIVINSSVETHSEVYEDAYGNQIEVEKEMLCITVEYKNVDEMAELYSFDSVQITELHNLMNSPEFLELFSEIASEVAGTGTPAIGSGAFGYPTASKTISAGYPYYSDGSYHGGVDFPVPLGSDVFAAADGTVTTVRRLDYSYGYYIIIDHGNGVSTLYAHNSELLVTEGESVHKGDKIALSGSTGNSSGPHCHFEIRFAGNRVNPLNYL